LAGNEVYIGKNPQVETVLPDHPPPGDKTPVGLPSLPCVKAA